MYEVRNMNHLNFSKVFANVFLSSYFIHFNKNKEEQVNLHEFSFQFILSVYNLE